MKVLVAGPGAIGRLMTAHLVKGGTEVALLDHDVDRARLLSEKGFLWHDETGSTHRICVGAFVGRNPAPDAFWDLLVVCVKSYQVAEAVRIGVENLREDGLVVVLSNGLGNLERVGCHWAATRTLAGTVSYGASYGAVDFGGANSLSIGLDGNGGVRSVGRGTIRIGPSRALPSTALARRRCREVVDVFRTAGMESQAVDEIEPVLWEKVALNCAINPVATILGVPNGQLPGSPAFAVAAAAAREAATVARAEGTSLPRTGWRERIERVCQATAANRCSMLVDLERGRRTEIDDLNGGVVERGEGSGVPVEVNRLLTSLVKGLENEPGRVRRER